MVRLSDFRFYINYMAVFRLQCPKMTNSVRALGYSLLIRTEIMLTILSCFGEFFTPGMAIS